MNEKDDGWASGNVSAGGAGEEDLEHFGGDGGEVGSGEVAFDRSLSRLEMAECKTGVAILRNGQVCRMQPPARRRVLGGMEADYRLIIRKMARFSGVKVMTYCLLENHFHLLLRVPSRERFLRQFEDLRNKDGVLLEAEGMGEDRLMAHLSTLYSKAYMKQLRRELADMRERGLGEAAEAFLEKYKRRFCDLSLFVKEVKERFSRWYNRKHQRIGTLWAGRFKSVLVEDGIALRTIAAYIDLNPVRAGIVEDPKDYRWCGYAEAVAGSRLARRGLCMVMDQPQDTWEDRKNHRTGEFDQGSGAWYRCWLMLDGKQVLEDEGTQANHVKIRKGVPAEKAEASLRNQGVLPTRELLLSRAKYLSEGAAIGSRSFVAGLFAKHRTFFGVKRKMEVKPLFLEAESEEGEGFELYSLLGDSGKEVRKSIEPTDE